MRNTIAKYKESLSRIASDVVDDGEEIEVAVPGSRSQHVWPFSERRLSRRLSQAGSPLPNGVDSGARSEIDPQRAEIERLQASEAEIKALAINYAAILKEKEEQLSRLHGENSSLRRSLEAKNTNTHVPRDEGVKATKNNSVTNKVTSLQGAFNQSPSKQHRHAIQVSPHSIGNGTQKENISNQGTFSNGHSQATFSAIQPNTELLSSPGNGNELASVVEENKNALAAIRANHESEIKQLKMQLEKEHEVSANLKLKFQDAYELNETSKNELRRMKSENERTSVVMKELQKKLDMKISEITRLQSEQNRRNTDEKLDSSLQNLKTTITTLEMDNASLKVENDRLNAYIKLGTKDIPGKDTNNPEYSMNVPNNVDQEKEEMTESIHKLKKMLEDTCKERDKAQRELARLKQHLLDKELEESDKMDEDSKTIEELRGKIEYQKLHILKLEKALKHELAKQEDVENFQSDELQKLNDINSGLKQKLADCMGLVDAKNIELLNLQTALGQYYAESEAKERLERDLAAAREGSAKLSELLNVAKLDLETSIKDKEELLSKLLHNERLLSESKRTVQKLQEDNSKLHRAVEQSMTRINRMSMDSDYHVDRRIVVKLLVTYFQRNHSKEVLDLMVRMLGFSDEDKRRIGFAQQAAGKTVVRGVLGFPGRLVGGILGGRSSDVSSETASENQSFADLWVDFLLKDAEQREKEESIEANSMSSSGQEKGSVSSGPVSNPETTGMPTLTTSFPSVHTYTNQFSSPLSKQTLSDPDAEFANVPLTSSVSPKAGNSLRYSRLLPKY